VERDIKQVGGDELRKSVVATVIFLVFSNPSVTKWLAGMLEGRLDMMSDGTITTTGIVVMAVLFFVVYWLVATYMPESLGV
jgi:hypothetical protein